MRNLKLPLCALLFCSFLVSELLLTGGFGEAADADTKPVHRLRNSVVGAAGSPARSTNYTANGTLGQSTPIGIGAASDVTLDAGFWGRYWIPTGVDEIPPRYRTALRQNFPNPFNPTTTIEYSLAAASRVEIVIFDVSGRRIKTLADGVKPAGPHREVWDGRNDRGTPVSSGIFFCRLRADSYSSVKKMILLR